jgi:hypothetical protein
VANVFERLGKVAQAEWSALRKKRPDGSFETTPPTSTTSSTSTVPASVPPRPASRAVHDVDGALRVLEMSGVPTLDEVRARYRALARRYQPKTQSARPDEAQAARQVLNALTEALELLEEHLLPVPP